MLSTHHHTFWPEPLAFFCDFPPSPSDSLSDTPLTPITRPQSAPIHVVCNAPLVAPIPLPYHSPTFLQFDLPDMEEDLSRPPYIKQSLKRKRDRDEETGCVPAKRAMMARSLKQHYTSTRHRRKSYRMASDSTCHTA